MGRVTRTHDDIDLAIWQRDLHAADRVLRDAGWVHQPQHGEDGYTGYGNGAIHLDLALLAYDACGVVYTPLQEGRGEWSQGAFGQDARELEERALDSSVSRHCGQTRWGAVKMRQPP